MIDGHDDVVTLERREIRATDYGLFVGADVTHFQILHDAQLAHHARCLVEATGLVGRPKLPQASTIGGIAQAVHAGDQVIALLALDARAELLGPGGRHWLTTEGLLRKLSQGDLGASGESIIRFRLPLLRSGEASSFHRIVRPEGMAVAILNMAAWLQAGEDGLIEDIRLAVASTGVRPFRARRTEDFLRGRRLDEPTLAWAAEELSREARVWAGPVRDGVPLRLSLVSALLERVLETTQYRVAAD
jgi:CO/xanthine dehydrogenase FAD-binding subunit